MVFEKQQSIGGLWTEQGKVWHSLRTNLSKYTVAFSDFPWPKEAPDFPKSAELRKYLECYAEEKGLLPYVHTSSEVQKISWEDGGWRVTWFDTEQRQQVFKFVIVASGIFSEPNVTLPGLDTFSGTLVVGGAFSGADVAAEIGEHNHVTVAMGSDPLWFLPRYIKGKPVDLLFYSRSAHLKLVFDRTRERILFSLASLLLLVLWIRHVHPEAYVVTFFVMVIAALAYLAKVTGMGDAVIGGRKVPIIRYIDWIATTPLMLFELCMIGGAEKHTFFMVIGCDLMMLAGGIVSAMIVPKKKVDVANGTVKKRPADVQQLFSQLEWLTIISWTGYPIVVLLGRAHAGLISKGTEDALLCMLDCISKIGMEGFVVATCSMEGAQKSKGATEDEKNERRKGTCLSFASRTTFLTQ
eukprot:g3430.t1